jgi:hypothetical protein
MRYNVFTIYELFNSAIENLMKSAWDGRLADEGGAGYESLAHSPAVNKGSKDWLNGAYTNSDSEIQSGYVICKTSDNPAPNRIGEFDNQDDTWTQASYEEIPDDVLWEHTDSRMKGTKDDLDMGYHYLAAFYGEWSGSSDHVLITDPAEIEEFATLRHPKEATEGKLTYEVYDDVEEEYVDAEFSLVYENPNISFDPYVNPSVASITYDQNDITISAFPMEHWFYAENTEQKFGHLLVCYKNFRTGTTDVVDSFDYTPTGTLYSGNPFCQPFRITSVSNATGDISDFIYLAVPVNWYNPYWEGYQLKVYRYDPSSDDWTCIANCVHSASEDADKANHDMGLAAEGDDLFIFNLQDDWSSGNHAYKMTGFKIEDAATRSSAITTFASGNMWDIPTPAYQNYFYHTTIDAAWDPKISMPRVAWTQWDYTVSPTRISYSGRVTFHQYTGQPNGLYYDGTISAPSDGVAYKIAIKANRYTFNSISSGDTGVNETFTATGCINSLYHRDVNVNETSGLDEWQTPYTVQNASGITAWETSLCSTAFGTSRHIWISNTGSELRTENGLIDKRSTTRKLDSCTNSTNLTGIFTTYIQYHNEDDKKIMIQQLEP